MTDDTEDKPQGDPLSFEHAQFDAPTGAASVCEDCSKTLEGAYYGLNGRSICEGCLAQHRAAQQGSFLKALALGTVAGIVGAAIYYAIRAVTGYDLALVTIVVGIAVGMAVRKGAGGSQSKLYRVLAVALTWVAMCSTYVPDIAQGIASDDDSVVDPGASGDALAEGSPPPAASEAEAGAEQVQASNPFVIVVAFALAMFAPVFLAMEMEIIALAIFGFGLWEAFRLSAPPPFEVGGPFEAAAPVTGPPPVSAPPA